MSIPPVTGPVRRLGADELPACLTLGADRQWPAEERKWRLLFEVGTVYGIDDPDGGLAATVVSAPYGRDVTAVSMMLVARRHERRGLGRRIMTHVLERAGTASVLLTATDAGKPLYDAMGFRTVGQCSTYAGEFMARETALLSPLSRQCTEADLAAVAALDADAFGAPRTALLSRLPAFCDAFRVIDGPVGVTAFGGAWRNVDDTVLGPVTAPDSATGLALLAALAAAVAGPVRLDIDHRQPALLEWASAHGLGHRFTTAVMVFGADLRSRPERLITPAMLALG